MFHLCISTPGIYFGQQECTKPSLDHTYMGGKNLVGTDLQLLINDETVDEYSFGLSIDTLYDIHIQVMNDEWMQFVVHLSENIRFVDSDIGQIECDQHLILFPFDFNSLQFRMNAVVNETAVENGNTENKDFMEITVVYAPYYTQAFIQTFRILIQNPSKTEL